MPPVRYASGRSGSRGHGSAHSGAVRGQAHQVESPGVSDRARAPRGLPRSWAARYWQARRRSRKGDPPRGPPRSADAGGGHAPGRGGRAGLRGSGGGDGARAAGSRSGLQPSNAGCSRRGPGRSAGRSRTGPGSVGSAPAAASPSGNPRSAVRPDNEHSRRRSQIPPKRATIRVGRACVPMKTGARPLEDSERLLRVLTCFGRR